MEAHAPHEAIRGLLQQLQHLGCDFSRDAGAALAPFAEKCVDEAGENGAFLDRILRSFGWDGQRFTAPIDVVAFSSRLKALMFDGLQHKGQGSYATVYKARDRLTGEVITLKKLRVDEQGGEGLSGPAIREVSLLRQISHPNIVSLKDVLFDVRRPPRLYLIMEYIDHDLQEYMALCKAALPVKDIKAFLQQLLSGIHFCHSHRILHRDLKPQNILIEEGTKLLKIADFGLARCFTSPHRAYTHEVVTLLYRAPEILLGTAIYTTAVDMWSVGCIFAELYLGRPLFQGDSEIGQLYKIFEILGTPDAASWPAVGHMPDWQPSFPKWQCQELHKVIPGMDALALDLLQQLLCYPPEQRITARQALDHPYLSGIRPRSPLAVTSFPPEPPPTPDNAQLADSARDSPHDSARDSAREPPPLPPAVRALKLTDMCRSHSDPGLRRQRGPRSEEQPVEDATEAADAEKVAGQLHEDEKQRGRPRAERMTTRSMDHKGEALAPANAHAGRTMKTRSMAAAEEAAQAAHHSSSSTAGSQLSSEHTSKPAAADANVPLHVLETEEQSSGRAGGRHRGKGLSRGNKIKGGRERDEAAAKEEGQEASDAGVSSELSDQTTVEVGEEMLRSRRGKP